MWVCYFPFDLLMVTNVNQQEVNFLDMVTSTQTSYHSVWIVHINISSSYKYLMFVYKVFYTILLKIECLFLFIYIVILKKNKQPNEQNCAI